MIDNQKLAAALRDFADERDWDQFHFRPENALWSKLDNVYFQRHAAVQPRPHARRHAADDRSRR